jgi:catechol 2,3-dioxygenase-like lactoylglutathione lyase family enzyme
MLDHVSLGVTDFARATAFYRAAFQAIGIDCLDTDGAHYAGYGANGKAFFWINLKPSVTTGAHVAFTVPDRDMVGRFHAAALGAGGRDNGAPGPRPDYHADYYAAFVFDPDGHNIEAVCHAPAPA